MPTAPGRSSGRPSTRSLPWGISLPVSRAKSILKLRRKRKNSGIADIIQDIASYYNEGHVIVTMGPDSKKPVDVITWLVL